MKSTYRHHRAFLSHHYLRFLSFLFLHLLLAYMKTKLLVKLKSYLRLILLSLSLIDLKFLEYSSLFNENGLLNVLCSSSFISFLKFSNLLESLILALSKALKWLSSDYKTNSLYLWISYKRFFGKQKLLKFPFVNLWNPN